MIGRLAVIILLSLVLVGCGGPISGKVVSKQVDEGHYYTYTQCHLVGKVTVCTPTTAWDDTDYLLDVETLEDGVRTADVDQATYEAVEVGDYYEEAQ